MATFQNVLSRKTKKIILSPHYDDFPLSLGGLALRWGKRQCKVEDWIVFSWSNYLVDDFVGNQDTSQRRTKVVSALRLKEEIHATQRIGDVRIKLCDQKEALLRGYPETTTEYDFPHGLDPKRDKKAIYNIQKLLMPLFLNDVQIFVPLAIRGHVDHLIVRNVVLHILTRLRARTKAAIFFYEDLPYAAEASKEEWAEILQFIAVCRLLPILFSINLHDKLALLDFYNSQTTKSYYNGVTRHARAVQKQGKKIMPAERIYSYQA